MKTVELILILIVITINNCQSETIMLPSYSKLSNIRVLSLDITGTLLVHRYPISKTYSDAALWANLNNPPSEQELKSAFKKAYIDCSLESPCFGKKRGISDREWWMGTVKKALEYCDRYYNEDEFNRYFRRIYQHYASSEGYEILSDAKIFLDWCKESEFESLGVTSNSPIRTLDTVLPMLGIHNNFKWFVCSQDIGFEKPSIEIFDKVYHEAKVWTPDLQRQEILHIGDNLAADYCGARAAGFQALFLDRSNNPLVTTYQDWIDCPEYPGKSEEDISKATVTNLLDVRDILMKSRLV